MWGKIEANKITKMYTYPVQLKDAQGTTHPKSYFQDNAKLETFYIYPVTFVNSPPIHSFLWDMVNDTYVWKSSKKLIEATHNSTAKNINDVDTVDIISGDPVLDDEGNQLVTLGLKSVFTAEVKRRQSSLLDLTDKWVIRKTEKGTAIPSTVTTWRDGIRSAGATMVTSISDAANFVAISALFDHTYVDGKLTVPAPLYNFPSRPTGMPE